MLQFALYFELGFDHKHLQVEEVIVRFTDEDGASEKMKECCPGVPFVLFSTKPGVKIEFVNPVPLNGLFSRSYLISDGDTYAKVVSRLAKDNKTIKGMCYFH